MAEIPVTPAAWMDLWLETQKRAMDAWADLAKASGGEPAAGAGWPETFQRGVDAWWQTVTAGLSPSARGSASRLLDIGKGYWRIGEAFTQLLESVRGVTAGDGDWQKAWQEGIKRFQESVCDVEGQVNPWSGFATFCGMPLDNWRRVVSSLSVLPGDLEQALRSEGPPGPDTVRRAMGRLLSIPPLGYTREWQEQVQEWGALWLEHAQAMQDYQTAIGSVGGRALDKLGSRLLKRAQDGKPVESLREGYDLWVDCAEDAYAEVAGSAGFIAAQARLTNTLMAVKRHEQQLVAELQSGFNMPTRHELNTSHRRVHELRRELKRVEEQVQELGLARLQQDLEGLRAELRVLRAERAEGRAGAAHASAPAAPRGRGARAKTKGEG
jgi:class III poly(R)-hydroxyalkanoic acid synthase PhaE subunit